MWFCIAGNYTSRVAELYKQYRAVEMLFECNEWFNNHEFSMEFSAVKGQDCPQMACCFRNHCKNLCAMHYTTLCLEVAPPVIDAQQQTRQERLNNHTLDTRVSYGGTRQPPKGLSFSLPILI